MLTRLGFFWGLAVLGGLLAPQLTLALGFGNFEVGVPGIQEKSIDEFVKKYEKDAFIRLIDVVIKVVRGVIIAVGLIVVVLGGYRYMTAGGVGSKVEDAKKWILAGLGGILLAILGQVLLDTISPQFSGDVVEPTLKFQDSAQSKLQKEYNELILEEHKIRSKDPKSRSADESKRLGDIDARKHEIAKEFRKQTGRLPARPKAN